MKIIAHKAQIVLVDTGTIVSDDKGQEDTVTDDNGVQIGNTFFMTQALWDTTVARDTNLKALVLRLAA